MYPEILIIMTKSCVKSKFKHPSYKKVSSNFKFIYYYDKFSISLLQILFNLLQENHSYSQIVKGNLGG